MPDLDQRIADGLRALVDRAPLDADVWPATERYVAEHRRHRRTVAGAVVAVALLAGVVVTVGVLGGAGSKVVVSHPSLTAEPQPVGPRGALTATGPTDGSFTITATPQLFFSPSAVTVTTGIYAITLLDGSTGPHTLNFDDPTTLWSELIVNNQGETKTSRIFFGQPGDYTFFCAIPGHRGAGQQGTVHITGAPMTLAQAEAAATSSR
jgi:plastocyanin